MLAAGLDGIERELPLPEPVEENLYHFTDEDLKRRNIPTLPATLGEAMDEMEARRGRPRRARRSRLRALHRGQAGGVGRLPPARLAVGARSLPGDVLARETKELLNGGQLPGPAGATRVVIRALSEVTADAGAGDIARLRYRAVGLDPEATKTLGDQSAWRRSSPAARWYHRRRRNAVPVASIGGWVCARRLGWLIVAGLHGRGVQHAAASASRCSGRNQLPLRRRSRGSSISGHFPIGSQEQPPLCSL